MRHTRTIAAIFCSAGAVAILAAAPASAETDFTWIQQYQRSSADATCSAPSNQTPWQSTYTGQQEWTSSWAQWPNGGRGGWVCTRVVIWGTTPAELVQYT